MADQNAYNSLMFYINLRHIQGQVRFWRWYPFSNCANMINILRHKTPNVGQIISSWQKKIAQWFWNHRTINNCIEAAMPRPTDIANLFVQIHSYSQGTNRTCWRVELGNFFSLIFQNKHEIKQIAKFGKTNSNEIGN